MIYMLPSRSKFTDRFSYMEELSRNHLRNGLKLVESWIEAASNLNLKDDRYRKGETVCIKRREINEKRKTNPI